MSYLENKTKIYVGNLPYTVDSNALAEMFSEFGEIVDAIVITDKFRGDRSKGFGFVEFKEEESAEKAISDMNEKEIEGRALVVNIAKPPRERDDR